MPDEDLQTALLSAVKQGMGTVAEKAAKRAAKETAKAVRQAKPEVEEIDAEELEAFEAEMSAADKLLAPIEDYRALSRMSGKTMRWLAKRGVDPYKCSLSIERREPNYYEGQKIKCGNLRGFTFNWPFDTDKVRERLEDQLGGEAYVFYIKHDGKPLRSFPVEIDAPPQNPPDHRKHKVPDAIDTEASKDDLEKQRDEEEKKARLLESRRKRLRIEKEIEKENPTDDPEPVDLGLDDGMITREEAERVANERLDKERLRNEIALMRSDSDRKFDALIAAMQAKGDDSGGMNAIVAAIGAAGTQQMEGLKLVVANVGQQLTAIQQANSSQFDNMIKLMTLSQDASAKVATAQGEGRNREMELLMELGGRKMEFQAMSADRQMELMKMGMEYAQNMATPQAGNEADWANRAASMLVNMIGSNVAKEKATDVAGEAAGGGRSEISEDQINTAAQAVAQRAIENLRKKAAAKKAAAGAPPDAAAPAGAPPGAGSAAPGATAPPAETGGLGQGVSMFIARAVGLLNKELGDRPVDSRFTAAILEGPEDVKQQVAAMAKISDLVEIAAPHVSPDVIGEIGSKLLDEKAQKWLIEQVIAIKRACGVSVEETTEEAP